MENAQYHLILNVIQKRQKKYLRAGMNKLKNNYLSEKLRWSVFVL